jgi:ABC-type amino acid transport/signal transduction systems, periplasmic component/domain
MKTLTGALRATSTAALVLSAALLAGCGSGGATSGAEAASGDASAQSGPSDTASSASADLDLVTPGTLTVALATTDPPSSFLDDNDEPDGYNVKIIEAIAAELGLPIEWKAAEYSVHIPNIANGTWDTATQGALVTEERLKQVDFSTPVSYAEARLVSLTDAPFATFADAAGKRVGVHTDALQAAAEREIADVEIVKYEDNAALLNALRAGQIDAYVLGQNTALSQQEENDDLALSEPVSTGKVAIPLPKGNTALVEAFDQALAKLAADGTLAELHRTYNSGVDIPDELKAAYPDFAE